MDENTKNFFWKMDVTCLALAIAELAKQTNTSIDEWHLHLVEQALGTIDSLDETEDGRKAFWQNGGREAWRGAILGHQKRYLPSEQPSTESQPKEASQLKQVGFARYLNADPTFNQK